MCYVTLVKAVMDCLFNVTIGGGYFPNDGSAPADGGVMPKFTPT